MNKIVKIILGIVIAFIIIILIEVLMATKEEKDFEKERIESIKNISYKIPKKFESTTYGDYFYYNNDGDNCTFRIDTFDYYDYKNGKEYLENEVRFTLKDKVSEIQEIELNNYKWYYLSIENDDDLEYYYATVKGKIIYKLEYTINDYKKGDNSNNYCDKQKDEIIATVKLK